MNLTKEWAHSLRLGKTLAIKNRDQNDNYVDANKITW